jgi:hypothetical protein
MDEDNTVNTMVQDTDVIPKKRGRGRPKKSELQAVRDSRKGKVGRPKGDNSRIQELKERLLATGGTRILDKVVQIAMDDNHQGQMAALKMCIDRILPSSVFDTAKSGGGIPSISINITGINNNPTIETIEEVQDITDVDVDD